MTGCSVEGCDVNVLARGLCSKHYQQWRKYGDGPVVRAVRKHHPAQDFLDQVISHQDHGAACILWPFFRNRSGHGDVWFRGRHQAASRAVCLAVHGPAPKGKPEAAHSCGNAACVNPRHLRWASHAENMADMGVHETSPRGEGHWNSRLTEAQVLEIFALKERVAAREAGRRYGVSASTIKHIWQGRTWAWLSGRGGDGA